MGKRKSKKNNPKYPRDRRGHRISRRKPESSDSDKMNTKYDEHLVNVNSEVEDIEEMDTTYVKKVNVNNPMLKHISDKKNKRIYNAHINVAGINLPLLHVNKSDKSACDNIYEMLNKQFNSMQVDMQWQFFDLVFIKRNDTYYIQLLSPYIKDTSKALGQDAYVGTHPIPNDTKLLNNLEIFVQKMIKDANLGEYIKFILDNNNIVRIYLDYYVGRPYTRSAFHKDTRFGHGFYTCLTFDIPNYEYVLGPELTHYNVFCGIRDENMQRQVFRPKIYGSYGQIGFNDPILIHSTPYTDVAERDENIFNVNIPVEILASYYEIEQHKSNRVAYTNSMRILPSRHRTLNKPKQANRPNFIRARFEMYQDLETLNRMIYGNESLEIYKTIEMNNDKFQETFSPSNVKNIVSDSPEFTDISHLNPAYLNTLFEAVCERAENAGGHKKLNKF